MFLRITSVRYLTFCAFSSVAALSQQNSMVPAAVKEFPVLMQQSIAAGKTPAGATVRAKLQAATLLNGMVIPKNAVLSGKVVFSEAKTSAHLSQLAIRMNSVRWKNKSVEISVYLTAWYYPATPEAGQSLQYGPPPSPRGTWNGQGEYPNPNSSSYKPFPGSDSDADKNSVPNISAPKISERPVSMKETELARSDDGTLVLVSKRTSLKLDKLTTYVFATADSFPKK